MMDNFKQVQRPKEEVKIGKPSSTAFGDKKKEEDNGLIVDNDFGDDFDDDEKEDEEED